MESTLGGTPAAPAPAPAKAAAPKAAKGRKPAAAPKAAANQPPAPPNPNNTEAAPAVTKKNGAILGIRKRNMQKAGVGTLDTGKARAAIQAQIRGHQRPAPEVEAETPAADVGTGAEEINEIEPRQPGRKAKPEQAAEQFQPWLIDRLEEAGLDHKDFASPQAAHKFLQKLRAPRAEQFQRQENNQQQQPPKKFDLLEGFNRDEIQAELGEKPTAAMLALIERMHNHYAQQFEQFGGFAQHVHQQVSNNYYSQIDSIFESLNSDYGGAFGTGSMLEIGRDSLEGSNRAEVFELADSISARAARAGRPISDRTAIRQAAKVVIGERKNGRSQPVDNEPDPEVEAAIARRRSQAVGSGTRGESSANPAALGKRTIAAYLGSR